MTPQIYLIPCVCSLMFDLLHLPELRGTDQTKQIYTTTIILAHLCIVVSLAMCIIWGRSYSFL